jgi:hypothetical protein
MLDALKFVQSAVAKKDYVQALTHFRIADGLIKGYNGCLALCSPINLELEISPRAIQFSKAIQACQDTIQLNMTPAGRLSVKSGPFKVFVDCLEEPFPAVEPAGEMLELDGGFLKCLRTLNPFISEDASRPWSRGVLFRGPSAYATNNVVAVEYWLGHSFPVEVNIPKPAVQELLRIGVEPIKLQVCENSVTFHYTSGRWLRTQTYDLKWPDVGRILNKPSTCTPLPEGFFPALESLTPFVEETGQIYFTGNKMTTTPVEGAGATVEVEGIPASGVFHHKQLQLLSGIATKIDFSKYPAPSPFFGEALRGAIAGMGSHP